MPDNLKKTPWNDIRVALLREFWGTKNSCNWIAGEINRVTGSRLTRNAVIGKVNRLGLSKRVIEYQPRQCKPGKPRNRRWRPNKVVDLFEETLPPADFIGIQFVETNQFTCMYPEGDGLHMLFCGQPRRPESSYCAAHHSICWVKPRPKENSRRAA